MSDRIEKSIDLKAPQSRVWRALTDHREFGTWFGVRLDGPFKPGQPSTGQLTIAGLEHIRWSAVVQKIEPERYFSYNWHPYAIDAKVDYSGETMTLVEFFLEKSAKGTLVRIVESGFEKLPPERRDISFRMNNGGWGIFRPIAERQDLLTIPNWPYAELARAWGGEGYIASTVGEFRDALAAAERATSFVIIETRVDPYDLSPVSRKYIEASARKAKVGVVRSRKS